MGPLMLAAICAGLFAGAAIYINAVEHPARLACGPALALRQFAPSYRRATVMQASLALIGCASALWSWWLLADPWVAAGGLALGAIVPFTLVVIFPTNTRLLDPALDPDSPASAILLARWGRLHAVRSVLSSMAFGILLLRLALR